MTLLVGVPAAAQTAPIDACIEASERGQRDRDAGKLLASRDAFVACAADACPKVIQIDCATWMAEVQATIPSVVAVARDTEGKDVVGAVLEIDGHRVDNTARAIAVDPGEHTLRWSKPGFQPMAQRIIVREGEHARRIEAVLQPLAASAPEKPAQTADGAASIPALTWVLASVSAASFGSYIGFGVSAVNQRDELAETCAPSCPPAEVDAAKRDMVIANVAFGLGVASAVGAVVVPLIGSSAAAQDGPAQDGPAQDGPAQDDQHQPGEPATGARADALRIELSPHGGYAAWTFSW